MEVDTGETSQRKAVHLTSTWRLKITSSLVMNRRKERKKKKKSKKRTLSGIKAQVVWGVKRNHGQEKANRKSKKKLDNIFVLDSFCQTSGRVKRKV